MGAVSLGSFAQIIVPPPPRDYQPNRPEYALKTHVREEKNPVVALALDVQGPCEFSRDGRRFHTLKKNMQIPETAVVRTGKEGTADLFLRRMGATIRVKPKSEVRLARSVQNAETERQEINTAVDVKKGRLLAVVHTNVPGSTLRIKNSAGQAVNEAVAGGRYIVSASAVEDASPEKLPAGAANDYDEKMSAVIKEQIEFDELQALAESWKDSNPGLEP